MPAAPDFPQAPDRAPVKRALISVSDKTRLIEAARTLAGLGVELVSTGGTRKAIADAGLVVKDISELTGFPEMMDGRVKTLHPVVHGGLLGVRDAPEHAKAMAEHGIGGIDLVYVKPLPLRSDRGGGRRLRDGHREHRHRRAGDDPLGGQEPRLCGRLHPDRRPGRGAGRHGVGRRNRPCAAQAPGGPRYARTAEYDSAISSWFAAELEDTTPRIKAIAGELAQTMRYGENPHQAAAFYRFPNPRVGVATARQLQGKELSYNNINDTDAAFELIAEFADAGPACAIIKHANPCGVATGATMREAYERALACDPTSAFGGIVALNGRLDAATAEEVLKIFTEVVIAPDADEDAIALFRKKKNVRLLTTGGLPDPLAPGETFRSVSGGFLLQSRDTAHLTPADLQVVTRRAPTDEEVRDMLFAFTIAKHVKSNAIVYARAGQTLGVGAGQMNRKDSARIAALRAADFGLDLKGSACASEAFFPFPDGLIQAADAGCTAVIQPGGSIGDKAVIDAADERGLAMVFTGIRVFRH